MNRMEPLRKIAAGVLEVAYFETGPADGPPVLLMHGFPYDIHTYAEVAPMLADQGCRVIVPHLRGHGSTRFLDSANPRSAQQAAVALKLRNLHGVHARVETLSTPFDLISCRAFASLPDFVTWSRSALAAPHGVWLAMKGKHPEDEIAALPADVAVFHVEQLTVPGLDAERCIVWMKPV
eukprot:gene42755-56833_t